MGLEMEKEILDGFVVESREHLNAVEDELLRLEKQTGAPEQESVNTIFRGIHTIKGGAGFLGLEKINSLSHVMETLLSMVRSNEVSLDATLYDVLLEGVDVLRTMIDNIDNQQNVDITKIIRRLKNIVTRRVSKEVGKDLKTDVAVTDKNDRDTGFTLSRFEMNRITRENFNLYLVKYDLNEIRKTRNKSPLSIIEELMVVGDIMDGRVETPAADLSQPLKDAPLLYYVLYISQLDPKKLITVLGLEKKRLELLIGSTGDEDQPKNREEPSMPQETAESSEPVANAPQEIEKDIDTDDIDEPEPENVEEQVAEPEAMGTVKKSSTVRINVELLDKLMNLAGELVLVRNQQLNNMDDAHPVLKSITQRLDHVTTEMQEMIMLTRMQPIGTILGKYPRLVRELSKKLGKNIQIEIVGSEVELDRTILESLTDPLTHIIRNCCDHGLESPELRKKMGKPETGTIDVQVYHEAGQINIEIHDDGQGIDAAKVKKKALERNLRTEEELAVMSRKEMIQLLFLPGFSTADKVSDVSGRGVGLDVVKSNIEKLNGSMEVKSTAGKGTTLNLKLPLTLAIIPSLIVRVGEERFAIPQVNLDELVALYDDEVQNRIETAEEKEIFRLRDRLLPLVRLNEVLANPEPFTRDVRAAITEKYRKLRETAGGANEEIFAVVKLGRERMGLIIDEVLGTEEIVVKPMHSVLRPLKCYSGATVMGDGRVAMILDVDGIAAHTGVAIDIDRDGELKKEEIKAEDAAEIRKILLFTSGENEQFALDVREIRRVEEFQADTIERVGEREFVTIGGVSTSVIRLHHHLDVSENIEKELLYLIIPKHSETHSGLLATSLLDILETPLRLNTESYTADGMQGTSIIKGKMTLFPDFGWLTRSPDVSRAGV
jgi:two-component system, chemotaxis family, sensor kinase CheA